MKVSDLFSVKNKTVLITGGSRGIGLMMATGFVENGARVYISSRSVDVCNKVAEELTSRGPGVCISLPADLQKMSDIEKLAETVKNREPDGLDVLINNSGAITAGPIDSYTKADFVKVLHLNLKSQSLNICIIIFHGFIPLLEKKGTASNPSRIINIGSIAAIVAHDTIFAYSASKDGLHHLSKTMAISLGPHHVTVNFIAPGTFPSEMLGPVIQHFGEHIVNNNPLGRLGSAKDIAGISIYLASKAGSYVNGAVIVIDGGDSVGGKM
ncbi:hypothetical protein BB560_004639 [Smittium megazygosporum]|uniref:Uncharacterized protein n=1 Tax=Smittium megazygosporum TaxID=133381 RepID=A0A2T9Z8Q3_9FUNG|nr:hypothetical protein BB560_004639 [Smittium megazygosporum]